MNMVIKCLLAALWLLAVPWAAGGVVLCKSKNPMEEKSSFFLTREMIREFIDRATEICLHELNQLAQGKAGLDSFEWSWIKQG